MGAAPGAGIMRYEPALLIGPGDDDIEVLADDDILDDDDFGPSSLDHEALTDDGC